MRIHVVSDVHGAAESLQPAAVGSDMFICLGDLVLYLDYADPGQGIYARLFGRDAAARYIELRTARDFVAAQQFSARLWSGIAEDRRAATERIVAEQYAELFAAMPEPSYLTFGNVDLPHLWPRFVRPGHHVLDGQCVEVDGIRFGFVGGGLLSEYRTPYELTPEAYAEKVAALGPVDVLCTHIPPDIPELRYDVVARRFERGSRALLDAIVDTAPAVALFGHVHQPLCRRTRVGRTECVNVGHFRASRRPFVLEL